MKQPREGGIEGVVGRARRYLSRFAVRDALRRNGALVLAAAAACAALRPLFWPLRDVPPSRAVLRAVVLAVAGALLAAFAIAVRAWRRRPSALASARQLDEALGLDEVVASGFAFEPEARPGEVTHVVVERARRALEQVDLERVFASPRRRRTRSQLRALLLSGLLAAGGLALGSIDRVVVDRVLHPLTAREKSAAAELARAAEAEAAAAAARSPDPKTAQFVDAARRAAAAAERGDRRGAHEALEEMRKAARERDAEEQAQARALRSIRDEVDGRSQRSADTGGREPSEAHTSEKASDALSRMMKELDSPAGKDPEALRKLAERLARAEALARDAARAEGQSGSLTARPSKPGTPGGPPGASKPGAGSPGKDGSEGKESDSGWSRAAAALKEAREASARGDSEGAKRALERAEKEIAELEKARAARRASSSSRLGDDASKLDRSLDAASRGKGMPSDDEGDGDGEPRAGGAGEPKAGGKPGGAPGTNGNQDSPTGEPGGGGAGDRAPGPEQRRVKVNGNLKARAEVREGERAVSAIDGMGKGGDPRAYREIFPSYDTAVEDGLREELVPAARRPTVRRYFSSIRPGEASESRK